MTDSTPAQLAPSDIVKVPPFKDLDYGFFIDVEATHDSLTKAHLPAIGAVCQKIGECGPVEGGKFHRYLGVEPPEGKSWGKRTCEEFWDNPEKAVDGKTQRELLVEEHADMEVSKPQSVALDFLAWINEMVDAMPEGSRSMIILDTAGFDFGMMSVFLEENLRGTDKTCDSLLYVFGGQYRPVRCISSFYGGLAATLCKFGTREHAIAALRPDPVPERFQVVKANHNPLRDAEEMANFASYIVSRARKIRDYEDEPTEGTRRLRQKREVGEPE